MSDTGLVPRMLSARYCGRDFTLAELQEVQAIIASPTGVTRSAISRAVCERLNWRKPDGGLKDMSCRVALLRMDADGLIALPAPTRAIHPRRAMVFTEDSEPGPPLEGVRGQLGAVELRRVVKPKASRLWNEMIERYHYLGYHPLPGAQLRYLAYAGERLLALLGFGAAAWKVFDRDEFIGWTEEQRQERLHLVVNNARFLVLPWISVRYLASSLLGQAARQLPRDWEQVYSYRPVLLETFVERERFRGSSYAAANWVCVGQTQGRGKLDRHKRREKPVKDIWVYPLDRRFRAILRHGRGAVGGAAR